MTEAQRSNSSPRGNQPTWRTILNLLGFGLLTALILLLAQGPPVDDQSAARVVFTMADIAQVSATFERTWGRPPTATELQRAFERYVRSEILYREALARGLDRNDPQVRMSLVRKITMLGSSQAQSIDPSDEELKAYFELRAERYRVPAELELLQVYVDVDERSETIDADAERLLTLLRVQDPRPEELHELGDSSMLPNVVALVTENDLARVFGEKFREAVLTLPVGEWLGPVESEYGLHFVKLIQRLDSRIPDWTEVRDRISSDLLYEGRRAAEDQFYGEVLPRYQILYADGVEAALGEPSGATLTVGESRVSGP